MLRPSRTIFRQCRDLGSLNRLMTDLRRKGIATKVRQLKTGKTVGDIPFTARAIAEREGCSVRKVNMTISLAFLAPDLVKAAIEGPLPHASR